MVMYTTIVIAIAVGWLGHSVYVDMQGENIPVAPEISMVQSMFASAEIMSPMDHIREEQIKVYEDHVVLNINDAIWSSFTDTNSMDPLLDVGANGIEIKPASEDDIAIGDVISYVDADENIVIHRVVEINSDRGGLYYEVKGDNNPITDNKKIRFENIQGVLVAVVY